MDAVAVDFVPERVTPTSLGAIAMQSRSLARVYQGLWRPIAFALSTGLGAPGVEEEIRHVIALVGQCAGPWLDVSCGPGALLRQLVAAGGSRSVLGLDLSRPMLERAHIAAPTARLVRADAAELPFEDATFGAITNLAALDLYLDPARVVREVARVLAPGGRWVCSTFIAPSRGKRASVFEAASGVRTPTLAELEGWTRDAGLCRFGHVLFRRYAVAWADSA